MLIFGTIFSPLKIQEWGSNSCLWSQISDEAVAEHQSCSDRKRRGTPQETPKSHLSSPLPGHLSSRFLLYLSLTSVSLPPLQGNCLAGILICSGSNLGFPYCLDIYTHTNPSCPRPCVCSRSSCRKWRRWGLPSTVIVSGRGLAF